MFPVRGGGTRGPGRGQGGGRGYGVDIGSNNWATNGNDIRIRNVLGHLSEGMQIGSHNVAEADNVIRIGAPANSHPPTQNRHDDDTGEVPGCWRSMVAAVQVKLRKLPCNNKLSDEIK